LRFLAGKKSNPEKMLISLKIFKRKIDADNTNIPGTKANYLLLLEMAD